MSLLRPGVIKQHKVFFHLHLLHYLYDILLQAPLKSGVNVLSWKTIGMSGTKKGRPQPIKVGKIEISGMCGIVINKSEGLYLCFDSLSAKFQKIHLEMEWMDL